MYLVLQSSGQKHVSPTLPVINLSTVKITSVPPAFIAWHAMVTGPSRTQAKLRRISEQLEPQRCSTHDPSAYGHALALTNPAPAMGK